MRLGFIARNDPEGLKQDALFAAEHEFEGLEFNYWGNFADLTEDTVRHMRATLDKCGVRAASLGLWGWNHLAADPAEREASLGQLGRAIDFAQRLGTEVLIAGGGQIPGASLDENVAEFAKVFPPYLDRAQAAGLTLAMYALHGNSFFASIEAFERAWEHVPDVGIKLDPANWQHHGDDYLPILRDYGDRVAHVHIKEHVYMDGEPASQPAAGMGDIQWGKVMAFLYEHQYEGYLIIEPHGPIWGKDPLRQTMILLSQRHLQQFLL